MNPISKQCPKCGYDDVAITFCKKGKTVKEKDLKILKDFVGKTTKPTDYLYKVADIETECVKIHCRTCQYAWASETAEAIGGPKEQKEPENAFGMSKEDIDRFMEEMRPKGPFVMDPFIDEPWKNSGHNPLEGMYPSSCGNIWFSQETIIK